VAVGDRGPRPTGMAKELEPMAARLGIADRILWTGSLEGALKWGAFSSSEVFVLPSHQENFGIVVAEAAGVRRTRDRLRQGEHLAGGCERRGRFVGADTVEGTKSSLRGGCAERGGDWRNFGIRARSVS